MKTLCSLRMPKSPEGLYYYSSSSHLWVSKRTHVKEEPSDGFRGKLQYEMNVMIQSTLAHPQGNDIYLEGGQTDRSLPTDGHLLKMGNNVFSSHS